MGPSGTCVFAGACELPEPGKKAGSELRIDSLVLPDGFGASAKDLCTTNPELANALQSQVELEISVPRHCAALVIPPIEMLGSSRASVQAVMFCRCIRPSAA